MPSHSDAIIAGLLSAGVRVPKSASQKTLVRIALHHLHKDHPLPVGSAATPRSVLSWLVGINARFTAKPRSREPDSETRVIQPKGRPAFRPCDVYYLSEHPNSPPVYVGQSRNSAGRLKSHIRAAVEAPPGRRTPVQRWVASLVRDGREPHMRVIETDAVWNIHEAVWIERLTRAGYRLLNVTSRVPWKDLDLPPPSR